MITTWADLVIKLAGALFGAKARLAALERERRDRVADYFDRIAETLLVAAEQFQGGGRPWERYREVAYVLRSFMEVTRDVFAGDEEVASLYEALDRAAHSDYLLLGDSRERVIVEAIAVRPDEYRYVSDRPGDPVMNLSSAELQEVIQREIRLIKEVAGLFRGVAAELRATSPAR